MFEVSKIKYAFIESEKKTYKIPGLLYLLPSDNYKVLITSQSDDVSHNSIVLEKNRLGNIIGLKQYLEKKGLDSLLYDYKFQLKSSITMQQIIDIYNVIRMEKYLDNTRITKFREMCSLISSYLILKLEIPEEKQGQFNTILKKYLMVDAIASSRSSINWFVTKENEVIDYKILRTLKGCGLDTNRIKQIENFKIRVSEDNIFISEDGKEEQLIYGPKPIEPQKIIKIG